MSTELQTQQHNQWANVAVTRETPLPDMRGDGAAPDAPYWAKISIYDAAALAQNEDVLRESLFQYRTAAEALWRNEREAPASGNKRHFVAAPTAHTGAWAIVGGNVAVGGDSARVVDLRITEHGTAQQALDNVWAVLDAEDVYREKIAKVIGWDAVNALPKTAPSPWSTWGRGSKPTYGNSGNGNNGDVANGSANATQSADGVIYIGKYSSEYPFVNGATYKFDVYGISVDADVSENGEIDYIWQLWGDYGGDFGKYPEFRIESARGERDMVAGVGETLRSLGLYRVIKKIQPIRLQYTTQVSIKPSKKDKNKMVRYFNPVKLEAALPNGNSGAEASL